MRSILIYAIPWGAAEYGEGYSGIVVMRQPAPETINKMIILRCLA